ncbi:MAG TPA: phosphoserine phosphatase [Polyangiaceae bacterium]|nr:phosphoserine phosphatase [Polyangiaceae bacterium]
MLEPSSERMAVSNRFEARMDAESVSVPKDGEIENGDLAIVRKEAGGTLLAVIDALGHGPHAAAVARTAAVLIAESPFPDGPLPVIEAMHERLRGTRGAAALVCIVKAGHIEACSVGNVEMRTWRMRLPIVLTPGIVGSQLRRPKVFGGDLPDEDRIVFFSDGVSARFSLSDTRDLCPADACRAVLKSHRRAHDDATVMVVDYRRGR